MKVDFNNLRIQTAQSYNVLVSKLNAHIDNGQIEVPAFFIERDLDDLRSAIVTLCCCFLENDESVKSVIDEVTPIAIFNKDEN